jgi:hypothetical protein
MPRQAHSSDGLTPPVDHGGSKRVNRDVVWDRPIFRPPDLPHGPARFDPLPAPNHFTSSHRPASGR